MCMLNNATWDKIKGMQKSYAYPWNESHKHVWMQFQFPTNVNPYYGKNIALQKKTTFKHYTDQA